MNIREIMNKLKTELSELRAKMVNLKIFLGTEKYSKMKFKQQKQSELLEQQLKAMEVYEDILISRISLLQNDLDNGDK